MIATCFGGSCLTRHDCITTTDRSVLVHTGTLGREIRSKTGDRDSKQDNRRNKERMQEKD